jgi:hypothetical protein
MYIFVLVFVIDRMIKEHGPDGNQITQTDFASASFCPIQILHYLFWEQTQVQLL